jgi:hypothetical protein
VWRASLAAILALASCGAEAREVVDATAPSAVAVTIYRDPDRGETPMQRDRPGGFAMITETRQVVLPPGESTIRFTGVAEGMVAVSAIVTGLPGGTIEKNRNADLLSPASLVDGTLGNRVTVTRTNPATGAEQSEEAVIRTRADGGLVLQTAAGYEAVRCSGVPEKLVFDRVPLGLAAQPVFSIDTHDRAGGTYSVGLTYLAWGFDWQAHYVATLTEPGRSDEVRLRLVSWLTLLNDNGQSFPAAELLVVAGRLNVVSDFRGLSDPPDARPLQLTCYPLGSTAAGSPVESLYPPPPPPAPPPPPMMAVSASPIMVTAARAPAAFADAALGMKAAEEALGDLKLYRVPEPVTVSAKGLKQIAFLQQDEVRGRLLYQAGCTPYPASEASPAAIVLETVNDKSHGLGMALPTGGITLFEPSAFGEQLVAETRLRDHAEGQDVELALGTSSQVQVQCEPAAVDEGPDGAARWVPLRAVITNANPVPARVRLALGASGEWRYRGLPRTRVKDGVVIVEITVPGNGRRELEWSAQPVSAAAS